MPLTLYRLHNRPDDYAVSKTGRFTEEGPYFLDFSRPLEKLRWLGIKNRKVGFTYGLLVPVIHAGADEGEFVVSVHSSEPYFPDIQRLWKERYPSNMPATKKPVDGITRIGEFAIHFPEDC